MRSRDLDPIFKARNSKATLYYDKSIDLIGDSWELAALLALDGLSGYVVTGEVIVDVEGVSVQPPGKVDVKSRCYSDLLCPPERMPYAKFVLSLKK